MRVWMLVAALSLLVLSGCAGSRTAVRPVPAALPADFAIARVDAAPGRDFLLVRLSARPAPALATRGNDPSAAAGVLLADLQQARVRKVSLAVPLAADVVWSPDGREIAYVVSVHGTKLLPSPELHVADLTRGVERTIVAPGYYLTPGNRTALAWSPDGARLALLSPSHTTSGRWDLLSLPVDGGAPLQEEFANPGRWWWSADGKRLLCEPSSETPSSYRPPAGSHAVTAPTLPHGESTLSWSPDGKEAAYLGFGGDSRVVSVIVVNRAGHLLMETGHLPSAITRFVWSPDGTRLAVLITSGGTSEPPDTYVLDVPRKTLSHPKSFLPETAGKDVCWVNWHGRPQLVFASEDGKRLLVTQSFTSPVYPLARLKEDGTLAFDPSQFAGNRG